MEQSQRVQRCSGGNVLGFTGKTPLPRQIGLLCCHRGHTGGGMVGQVMGRLSYVIIMMV